MSDTRASIVEYVRRNAVSLSSDPGSYDGLMERVGDARFVLLGECTHGTHEFYRERAQITKRLIRECGFHALAIEGDWPDAHRVHRYVQGQGNDADAELALVGFKRFPAWMWRNADVLDFVGWLRQHNECAERMVGFYGLDLYSLHASIEAIVAQLERIDPRAAGRARERYACFDHFGQDTQAYSYATGLGLSSSCETQVLAELLELHERAGDWIKQDGRELEDQLLFIEQNARVVKNAERYYRSMFKGRVSTWNMRDQHMLDTLEAVASHLDRRVGRSRIVVWEHNSHLGDARATDMGLAGEWNLGQLVRERFGQESVLVGFTTYEGTVTAASDWDRPAERMTVRPALAESYESIFHEAGIPRFMLGLEATPDAWSPLDVARLERAIGVIYRPETERISHYFRAQLTEQFDVLLHFDRTRAVEPLERSSEWVSGEAPETYPFAL